MAEINLPQGSYNAADLIAAIQQSNDAEHQQAIDSAGNAGRQGCNCCRSDCQRVAELEARSCRSTEQGNLLQAILHTPLETAVEGQSPSHKSWDWGLNHRRWEHLLPRPDH